RRRAAGDRRRQGIAPSAGWHRSNRIAGLGSAPRILRRMFDMVGAEAALVPLTLYTDSFVIKGQIRSRQNRVTDILNHADEEFLVLSDAVIDEYGTRALATRSEYAQVNLDAVLFAVAETTVEARPDLRTPKVA